MAFPASLPVPEEDFNKTPAAVQALVLAQWEEILALREQISALREQIGVLTEQVSKNSKNSSHPPSSDPPSVEKPKRSPSGRTPGGQPGHKGRYRPLKPTDEVKEVISLKPSACKKCGHSLCGEDKTPQRHQVTDIPPVVAETIEYQLHLLECPGCGTKTRAQLPREVACSAIGPHLMAMVATLSGQYHLSKRQIKEIVSDFFGADIGLGTVHALEQSVCEALKEPVAEVGYAIKQQPLANVDETSWQEGDKKSWLWVAVTPIATMFLLRLSRSTEVAKELICETFSGIVGSDRWSAYSWIDPTHRQVCWAHLLRDFEAFICRGGTSEEIGRDLLSVAQQMFHFWHRVRDGTLSRTAFSTAMVAIKQRVSQRLCDGVLCDNSKTQKTCRNLLTIESALWTFVDVLGVEPTNNAAERAVRSGVLWRKGSFGTQSENGSRFVERMMTTVATLKQQKRNVLHYLIVACNAHIKGENAPSLLPDPTA